MPFSERNLDSHMLTVPKLQQLTKIQAIPKQKSLELADPFSPSERDLPKELPLLPLYTRPLFPYSRITATKERPEENKNNNNNNEKKSSPFNSGSAPEGRSHALVEKLKNVVRRSPPAENSKPNETNIPSGDLAQTTVKTISPKEEISSSFDSPSRTVYLKTPIAIIDDNMVESLIALKESGINYLAVSLASLRRPDEILGTRLRMSFFSVGVLALLEVDKDPQTEIPIVNITGLHRILLSPSSGITARGTYFTTVTWKNLPDEPYAKESPEIKTEVYELISKVQQLVKLNHPLFHEQYKLLGQKIAERLPEELCDLATSLTYSPGFNQQIILQEMNIPKRLKKTNILLGKELDILRLLSQAQQKNGGTEKKATPTGIIERLKERMEQITLPEDVKRVVDEEMNKLKSLNPSYNASEHYTCRNYLTWILGLPWGIYSNDILDIKTVGKCLDEDHYGLEDVKERILEFIAVAQLKGSLSGKIVCLVGPPGVGKTSIGKSIARALERKFYRFSVGGTTDSAEMKGHRRTYVGALPGKLIQALKVTQTSNPVILIDEIDKMSKNHQGDPASVLLEVLDPEQNKTFLDHYLDVPYDLSKVLFICTANNLNTIPRPLLDRMEIINISGYFLDEKICIAKNYLIPKLREETSVPAEKLDFEDSALKLIVDGYCREPGVRSLEKELEKIFRKSALIIAKSENQEKILVTTTNLESFIGKRKFLSDKMYKETPPGVVTGLAWSSMGGSLIWIETVVVSDNQKPDLKITGKLGKVMQESTSIAFSYAKKFLSAIDSTNPFFHNANLHIHFPEGATPKDGPSAGCAIVTSFISLALNKSVQPNTAMTGEISLTGKVLPVGGIKEKVMAAQRSNISTLFLPLENQSDYEELSDSLTKDITVHFVENYQQIFDTLFSGFVNEPHIPKSHL